MMLQIKLRHTIARQLRNLAAREHITVGSPLLSPSQPDWILGPIALTSPSAPPVWIGSAWVKSSPVSPPRRR